MVFAVAVQVFYRYRPGVVATRAVCHHRLEGSVAVSQQHSHKPGGTPVTARGGHQDIGLAVPVHICDGYRRGASTGAVCHHRLECSIAVTKQNPNGVGVIAVRNDQIELPVPVQIRDR